MNKKNNYVYIILAGIAVYFLLNKKKQQSFIIVDPLQKLKPYVKAGTNLYAENLNTPIYTFAIDTFIEILEEDKERGIVKIQFKTTTEPVKVGFISQYKIIYK